MSDTYELASRVADGQLLREDHLVLRRTGPAGVQVVAYANGTDGAAVMDDVIKAYNAAVAKAAEPQPTKGGAT